MTANVCRGLSVTMLATALLTTACVTATKKVQTQAEVAAEDRFVVEPGDAIAIISEEGFECLSKSLQQVQPDLRIVPPDEFRRVAFPDERGDRIPFTSPIPEAQRQLLSAPDFRDRVAPLNLRYLVSIGKTERFRSDSGRSSSEGPLLAGAGEVKYLTLRASVLDLQGREVGRIVADAEGIRAFGVILFFPLFLIETTDAPACNALGQTLADFLSGRFPSAPQRAPEIDLSCPGKERTACP